MKFLVVFLLAAICANALTTEHSFQSWMDKHNKNYVNEAEYTYRLGVYRSNLEFIEEHNKLNVGFTVAMNQFGDLTVGEFSDMYNNYKMDSNRTLDVIEFVGDMAGAVDWRTKGAVTGVKNQGKCGSCWSFSTTGAVEGQWAIHKGKLVSLSEQQLIDCSRSYGNHGCDGGLMDNAFNYIKSNGGIDTEKSYPYEAKEASCRFKSANVAAKVSGHHDVKSGDEASLAKALDQVGPISVAIDASHSSFQFYSGGTYYEAACSSTRLDHGVLAVGYGSDHYIVKNSWGDSWGSQGYIMMARNRHNNCGIATSASYPSV